MLTNQVDLHDVWWKLEGFRPGVEVDSAQVQLCQGGRCGQCFEISWKVQRLHVHPAQIQDLQQLRKVVGHAT